MINGGGGDPRLGADDQLAGRYTLISEIGRGGTGTVWRAADRVAGREVAVKVLHQRLGHHEQLVSGFVRQRTALTGIEHPHLVTVHDLVFDDGIVALVSELIEGQTLR
jgi:serine/threonine protein kinase